VSSDDQRRALARLLRATTDLAASGDATAAETLWLAFEGIARHLATLTNSERRLRDYGRLGAVLKRCIHQLKVGLSSNQIEALAATYGLTERGCQLLKMTSDKNPEFIAGFAERIDFWPVLMATKQMYHDAADKYLRAIRVGEESIPPTVSKTKIDGANRWTQLAAMLISDIVFFRSLLSRAKKGSKSTSAFEQKIENDLRLSKARYFPRVSKLRSPLNHNNRNAWWKEAKPILKYYWEENPDQASEDWKLARRSSAESGRTYAIRRVHSAFNSLSKSRKST
jgi:hypothetical protein